MVVSAPIPLKASTPELNMAFEAVKMKRPAAFRCKGKSVGKRTYTCVYIYTWIDRQAGTPRMHLLTTDKDGLADGGGEGQAVVDDNGAAGHEQGTTLDLCGWNNPKLRKELSGQGDVKGINVRGCSAPRPRRGQ
jgi:hypothetical protein